MKIEVKPINLKYQKPKEVKKYYVELFETHLTCVIHWMANQPIIDEDESSGWEDKLTDSEIFIKRSAINGIDRYYVRDPGVYCVLISANGIGEDFKTYFETRKEAREFMAIIQEWVLK